MNKVYNISKKPLLRNFECKITFLSVGQIRVGITFQPKIDEIDEDFKCPPYDIYCIFEDLKQFYTYNNKWKFIFNSQNMELTKGDSMIMRFKFGELRYYVKIEDLIILLRYHLPIKKNFNFLFNVDQKNLKLKLII